MSSDTRQDRRWRGAGYAAALLIAVFTASRVWTVVTGVGDLTHYFTAARAILDAASWQARLRSAFVWAPGWPVLLALVMATAGAAWVYVINPVLVALLLGLAGSFGRRTSGDARTGFLTVLAGGAILLFGAAHNAYFLVYPFRETLSFVLLYAAMLAVLVARMRAGRARWLWLAAAGCAYGLAAAVREPAILAVAGGAACVLLDRRHAWRSRLAGLLALAMPLLAALTVLLIVFRLTGVIGSDQFAGWRSMTQGVTLTAWFRLYCQYLLWLFRMPGAWSGVVVLAGAVWMLRRHPGAAVMLAVSLLATVALYATFAFYPRYALSGAIFLVPFAGAGLMLPIRVVERLRPRYAVVVLVAFVALSGGWMGRQGLRLAPWGGSVGRRALRDFVASLDAVAPAPALLLTDARSRMLHDVLTAHLGRPYRLEPPSHGMLGPDGLLFLQPANAAAVTQARVALPPFSLEESLLRIADLDPVTDAADDPLTLYLGPAAFAVYRVRPWRRRSVELSWPDGAAIRDGVFWLDFRQSEPAAERVVRLTGPDGETVRTWPVGTGNGLIPFAWSDGVMTNAPGLSVTSDHPLPRRLPASPDGRVAEGTFTTGPGRALAVLDWIRPPTYVGGPVNWPVAFTDRAAFAFPAPRGMTGGHVNVTILLQTRFPEMRRVAFRYTWGGDEPEDAVTACMDALDAGMLRHTIQIPVDSAVEGVIALRLEVDVPTDWGNHFRVQALGVAPGE